MKSLLDKIYEWSTPDEVEDDVIIKISDTKELKQRIHYDYMHNSARAFILNIDNMKIAMGSDKSTYHYDIIEQDVDNGCEKMGLKQNEWTSRIEKGQDIEDFYEKNPHMKHIRCGRLWDVRDDENLIILGWWEELNTEDYYKYTIAVLNYYGEKFNNKIDFNKTHIICVNNNGELFVLEVKEKEVVKQELQKRTKASQELYGVTKAIHLANQKDKNEFYKEWKARVNKHKDDEMQMLGWRDKDRCYAKRNDKFAKHIVKDPSTGKYKVVYGAKIGDSLINKHITDFISE